MGGMWACRAWPVLLCPAQAAKLNEMAGTRPRHLPPPLCNVLAAPTSFRTSLLPSMPACPLYSPENWRGQHPPCSRWLLGCRARRDGSAGSGGCRLPAPRRRRPRSQTCCMSRGKGHGAWVRWVQGVEQRVQAERNRLTGAAWPAPVPLLNCAGLPSAIPDCSKQPVCSSLGCEQGEQERGGGAAQPHAHQHRRSVPLLSRAGRQLLQGQPRVELRGKLLVLRGQGHAQRGRRAQAGGGG